MASLSEKLCYPHLCALVGAKTTRLSQSMHNAGFVSLNLPFSYVAFNTVDTEAVIKATRELGIRGLSLTIPHKETALTLVDQLSLEAKEIGAINTVINDGEKLTGYNTDCYGIEEAFAEKQITLKDKTTLLIGAGGASRAALSVLSKSGAQITIANRTFERAQKLAGEFDCQAISFEELGKMKKLEFDILINSSSLGSDISSGATYPFSFENLPTAGVVFDFVTKETELTKAAEAKGLVAILGQRMLLHQATKQFELFTEKSPPVDVMEKALLLEINKAS
jgi:shikimate dehydrogenase